MNLKFSTRRRPKGATNQSKAVPLRNKSRAYGAFGDFGEDELDLKFSRRIQGKGFLEFDQRWYL